MNLAPPPNHLIEPRLEMRLEPHPARQIVHGKPVVLILDQQQVMVKDERDRWVRVAYCGVKPSEGVFFIRDYPEAFIASVKQFVDEQLGGEATTSAPPPAPPEPEADEPGDYDSQLILPEEY